MPQRRIVVVAEDDDELRALLVESLAEADRQVVELEDGAELRDYFELLASRGIERSLPDLILTDVQMPGESGLDVVRWARARGFSCPFVILTGHATEGVRRAAAQLGGTQVLSKPRGVDEIRAAVAQGLGAASTVQP